MTAEPKHMLLKPCPFCGRLPVYEQLNYSPPVHSVGCERCNISFQHNSELNVVSSWNKRVKVVKNGKYDYNSRPIKTSFEYPPIPDRNSDWSAIFEDTYDYDSYVGRGATEVEAVIDLIEQVGMS
jgi:Lar family restriction alleviation protein